MYVNNLPRVDTWRPGIELADPLTTTPHRQVTENIFEIITRNVETRVPDMRVMPLEMLLLTQSTELQTDTKKL